jgi:hypothetical protein
LILPPDKAIYESDGEQYPGSALWRRLAQFFAVGGAVYFFLHSILVLNGSERFLMDWLYDDAFYYLIVAKHFSEAHLSSFDGVTVTSGYHPLWMWLCSVVYGARGKLDLTYVRLCMGVSICISVGLLVFALRQNRRKEANGWLWALALASTSYSALNNGLTVMEWPLVLLWWALLHRLVVRTSSESSTTSRGNNWAVGLGAVALGVLGSLSRSDFGLIPACYVGAGILIGWRYKQWGFIRTAVWALGGSMMGLGLVFYYNHAMTGSWLQQSAEVKRMAASLSDPFNPVPALWQFLRVILYLPRLDLGEAERAAIFHVLLPLLALVTAIGLGWTLIRHRSKRESERHRRSMGVQETFVLLSSAFGIVGYLFVYSFNSQATYGWYSATVTGFVLILTAKAISLVSPRMRAAFVAPIVLVNVAVATYSGGNARTQFQENSIGRLMYQEHPGALMGGGDVGKPSFYNGGTMINLDGLMNNEVVPYLAAGNVPCYILKRQIEYLSDTGSLTEEITNAVRVKLRKPPIPWSLYFPFVEGQSPTGERVSYLKTDFGAIRRSGECLDEHP